MTRTTVLFVLSEVCQPKRKAKTTQQNATQRSATQRDQKSPPPPSLLQGKYAGTASRGYQRQRQKSPAGDALNDSGTRQRHNSQRLSRAITNGDLDNSMADDNASKQDDAGGKNKRKADTAADHDAPYTEVGDDGGNPNANRSNKRAAVGGSKAPQPDETVKFGKNGDGGNDEELQDESPDAPFPKASPEELSKRRIIKVNVRDRDRPVTSEGSGTSETGPGGSKDSSTVPTKNPFAAALAKTGAGVFGSAFTASKGFGAAKGFGFGSSNTGKDTNKTAGGFGSEGGFGAGNGFGGGGFGGSGRSSSGFGNLLNKTKEGGPSVFGGTPDTEKTPTTFFGGTPRTENSASSASTEKDSATQDKTNDTTKSIFSADTEVINGEEGYECVFTSRAKAFVLIEATEKESSSSAESSSSGPIPMSLRPSLSTNDKSNGTDTDNNANKETPNEDSKTNEQAASTEGDGTGESSKEKNAASDGTSRAETGKKTTKWQELGIGPLRIISKDSMSRVVHRRESAAGSMGTKLLVNVALPKECRLTRPSEKHVQLASIRQNGKPAVYLFKLRNAVDAKALEDALAKEIQSAESIVKK